MRGFFVGGPFGGQQVVFLPAKVTYSGVMPKAKKPQPKPKKTPEPRTKRRSETKRPRRSLRAWIGFLSLRSFTLFMVLTLFFIGLTAVINPPTTYYMWSESRRLGEIDHEWIPAENIAPVMLRSAVAAEDANFCLHWGFDVMAIRNALDDGGNRGASTISQQVVKNVFLWPGRNWLRKAMEAFMTPVLEAVWTKRRILEVYLNVAEFGSGVFGIDAASHHYFGTAPASLSPQQAALLAAILPNPKERSAKTPSTFVSRRASSVQDGAALIRKDGRAACFED